MPLEFQEIKGCKVYPFHSVEELINTAETEKKVLIAINAEKVVLSTPETRAIINRNIGYCDGAGPVKVLRRRGLKNVAHIPGCELWLKIIERYVPLNKTFYLIGSRQEVIEQTIKQLRQQFPQIRISGWRNGFLKDIADRNRLIDDVAEKKPDVVFVAMGSPRQEILMEQMCTRHPAIYQGLGGSFDVYTGHAKRAPHWVRRLKLEWLYRFYAQPSRTPRIKNYINFLWQMETGKL